MNKKITNFRRMGLLLFCTLLAAAGGLNAQIIQPLNVTQNFTIIAGAPAVNYYDDGGADCSGEGGAYAIDNESTAIICPDVAGQPVTIEFLEVDIESRNGPPCWDFLNIYDGNSIAGTQVFTGCGEDGFQACASLAGDGSDGDGVEGGPNDMNGSNVVAPLMPANNIFTSTDPSGCLTVEWDSDDSVPQGGWTALVSAPAVVGIPCTIAATCPMIAPLPCGSPLPAAPTTEAEFIAQGGTTGAMNCGTLLVSSTDTPTGDACTGLSVLREITLTDPADPTNTSTCTQTITIAAPGGPTINVPATATADCFSGMIIDPSIATVTTDCNLGFTISTTVPAFSGPPECAGTTATIVYIVTDDCGRMATDVQVVTNTNTDGLVITGFPANKTVDCLVNVFATPYLVEATTSCDGSVTVSSGVPVLITAPGTDDCNGAIYRIEYTVEDNCGRIVKRPQLFTLNNEGPEFVCPTDICIIECPEDPAMIQTQFNAYAGLATVNTSCVGQAVTITNDFRADRFINNNCNNNGSFAVPNTRKYQIVTFRATTCSGTTSCTAIVAVVDNEPPVIQGTPTLGIAECGDRTQIEYDAFINSRKAMLNPTDACIDDALLTISHRPLVPNEECGADGYAITEVFFTVSDGCNEAEVEVHFKLKNNFPPTLEGLTNRVIQCDDPIPPFDTPTVKDACGVTNVTFVDSTIPGDCGREFTMIRTFTVTDNCGGSSTAEQRFAFVDTLDPVASNVPAAMTLSCGDPLPTTLPTFTDVCDDDVTITTTTMSGSPVSGTLSPAQEVPPSGSSASGTVTGGYDANTGMLFLNISFSGFNNGLIGAHLHQGAAGSNGPVVVNLIPLGIPALSLAGSYDVMTIISPDLVQALEDGLIYVNLHTAAIPSGAIRAQLSTTEVCGEAVKRIFTGTDDCGNTASASQTITFIDDQAPVAPAAPADVNVQCASDVPAPVDLTAFDICDGDITVSPSAVITPGNCNNQFTMVRTWTFVDMCGNQSSVSQTINVDDTTPPDAPAAPADVNVQCASEVPGPVDLTASDNCDGDITVSPSAVITPGDCDNQFTMVRTWTFVDMCGNQSSVSQTINVDDTTPPVFTFVPETPDVDCDEVPDFVEPIAEDNCGNVSLSFEERTSGTLCDGGYSLKRIYTATDDCGNTSTVEISIWVNEDNDPPVFTFVPETADVNCDEIPDFVAPIAEDNCSEVTLTFTESQSGTLCDGGYSWKRQWTATDDCGNTATVETAIWVNEDNEAPVFTFVPETPDVNCDEIPDFVAPTAEDNCSEVTLTFTESQSGTLCDGGYSWKRQWTATDDCGNTATVETSIWVNEDNEGPVFTFVPEGGIVDCVDFPPTFGEVEVSDNCSDVNLTSIIEFIDGDENSCANGENFDYRRVWTATDDCGNTTTTKQTFWIIANQPPTATISGSLMTEEQEMVENVTLSLESGNSLTLSETTEAEGIYEFPVGMDNNYSVEATRNDNHLNGVTTYDLILMGQHILGMQELDSPYKLIAADVNNSGTISSLDMVALRRLILHIDEEFSANTSWRFVDMGYNFPNPTNPFATTFPEAINFNGLTQSEIADFMAVKIGDLNASATANSLQSGDTRSADGELVFTIEEQKLVAGEAFKIDFRAQDFTELTGYQYTINLDSRLDFVDVQPGVLAGLTNANFGLTKLAEGVITTSWNSRTAEAVNADEVLFSIVVTSQEAVKLSEVIRVSSDYTTAEAYRADSERMEVRLSFIGETGMELAADYKLYQNTPNPFRSETVIGFSLPEAATATVTIYDVSGRVLRSVKGDYAAGYHELRTDRSELNATGVLYYQLATKDFTDTKKMILVK